MGGCRTPDLVSGPLHATSATFTTMFMVTTKRMTDSVSLVIIANNWRRTVAAFPVASASHLVDEIQNKPPSHDSKSQGRNYFPFQGR